MVVGGSGGVADHPRSSPGLWSGRLLYPVLSRRSEGLSLGVNLFPGRKRCNFDCAYCEVAPDSIDRPFDLGELEGEFEAWASDVGHHGMPLRDISISGDGEPTLSPSLPEVIDLIDRARSRWPLVYGSALPVLITNSTGFLDPGLVAVLHGAIGFRGFRVWAKLDAGNEGWYRRLDRQGPAFDRLLRAIGDFAVKSPITIQTMCCSLATGKGGPFLPPPESEIGDLVGAFAGLLARGALIRDFHLYTQARPSPHGLTAPLSDAAIAAIARFAIGELRPWSPVVRAFGALSEIPLSGGPA